MNSQLLIDEDIELKVEADVETVLKKISLQHSDSWLIEPYAELMGALSSGCDPRIALHGVELWSGKRGEVVAGELGYSIGSAYTSLAGFCSPRVPELRHFGTLQLYLLAEMLRDRGYAFWNLGHPSQPYKQAIGAQIMPRGEFLGRWMTARDDAPEQLLAGR